MASLPHFLPFVHGHCFSRLTNGLPEGHLVGLGLGLKRLTNGLPEGHLVGASNPTRIRIVRGRPRELFLVGGVKSRTQIWLVELEEDLPPFDLDRQLVVLFKEGAMLALRPAKNQSRRGRRRRACRYSDKCW